MSPASAAAGWGRRAGVIGAAAGAMAAAAALGVVTERKVAKRVLRPGAGVLPEPLGASRGTETVVVAADGVPLHAEIDGADDAPLTIVLVHGYALDMRCWHYQRRDLAAYGRVVLYDQRGHGRSTRGDRSRATIDQLGRDLHSVLSELAPDGPVVLIGHSMGGMTVMALAEHYPELFGDRIIGVGLCSTSAGKLAEVTLGLPARAGRLLHRVAPGVMDQLARRPALVEHGRRVGSDLELLLTKKYAFGSEVPTELVDFVSDMISTTSITTLADFYPAFQNHDKLSALGVLDSIPTLVLVGDEDLLTPADHSRSIAESLPTAELEVVPDAGHLVMLEHPETVNAHLRTLVERAAPWVVAPPARRRAAR